MSIPLKDSLLVPYSTNMNDRLVASPSTYDLTAEDAASYTARHQAFLSAYSAVTAARADGTESKSLTSAKDSVKVGLLNYARQIYSTVKANMTVSDSDKILLGIHLGAQPKPAPRPSVRPGVEFVTVNGRTVEVFIHDSASSAARGKPAGTTAAWVYSFVGETYPANPAQWNFEGACTRGTFEMVFPDTVPGGARVWICAAWINAKQEAGPTSVPISTNVQGGGAIIEMTMKVAA